MNAPFFVSPYPQRGVDCVKLEIRQAIGGKKIRRFFRGPDALALAYQEGERLTSQIQQQGTQSLDSGGTTVRQAFKLFDRRSGKKAASVRHKRHIDRFCDLFVTRFGKLPIRNIGTRELELFWDREQWPEGSATRYQAACYLRIVFNWLERKDLIEKNPMRKVDFPTKPEPLAHVLTIDQARVLLDLTGWHKAFVVLGMFGGLRSSEILRIRPEHLDWTRKEIHVPTSKTGQRYVRMTDAFVRHMPRDFSFPNERNLYASLRLVADIPQNALRHTWFTYHLAESRNAAVTAHEGGNSEAMVKKVYALPARRADAEAFWAL